MANQSQNSGEPTLCVNNCGFYGNPSTNNLCSKCFKDYIMNQTKDLGKTSVGNSVGELKEKSIREEVGEPVVVDQLMSSTDAVEVAATTGTSSENPENNTSRPPNRCWVCKKRVGLTGFKCKCEHTFCSSHRYSDKHNCVFNYKSAAQDAIARANPVVKADKIEKI